MLPGEVESVDQAFRDIWRFCQPYTMTSFERGHALFQSVRYIIENNIEGEIIECGVWRGGSSMIAMFSFQHFGAPTRRFRLFDTYAGMTAPSDLDVDLHGRSALEQMAITEPNMKTELVWGYADLAEVRSNVAKLGYNADLISFVEGDIRETALKTPVNKIALLHLDTDFYDSTLIELETFYPLVADGGVVLIDNYGHWQGSKKAVDEYFNELLAKGFRKPLLNPIDYTGRLAVKPSQGPFCVAKRRDFHSPTLQRSHLLQKFPSLSARDPYLIKWPYLRSSAPHIWRSDLRSHRLPDTGVLSVEEAELLFNNTLAFKGHRALEIGCHYGWSTAHLAAAGVRLDVVDPALSHEDQRQDVEDSLAAAASDAQFCFWPGYSPLILPSIHSASGELWSFAFIDGFHEGDAPRQDAEVVARYCAETACVMFHDMTSPYVAAGLRYFLSIGWSTGIYNTMQIMGIAWRGSFRPVTHASDPEMPRIDHPHLEEFTRLSL